MKLNRNPVFALLAAATLFAAGCGVGPNTAPVAPSAHSLAVAAAVAGNFDALAAERKDPVESDFSLWTVKVVQTLPDDNEGSKHQTFIVTSDKNENKIRIAHNTDADLSPKVPLKVGDTLIVKGIFIKTGKGLDVLHWTHYNPRGGAGGYVELNGKRYDRPVNVPQSAKKTASK